MNKILLTVVGALLTLGCLTAYAGNEKADIKVMTQNQYFGADFTPIVESNTNEEFAVAIFAALQSIAANNFQERRWSLAESIDDRQPHLVALQEVFAFECIDAGFGACALFQAAFNEHLDLTMAALDDLGADYYVAAEIQNLTIPTPFMQSIGLPGLPVFLPGIAGPAMFVSVIDRDVILARGDVATSPVVMNCLRQGPGGIGCNYDNVATVPTLAGPIAQERGYVVVDAWVDGAEYRFVNTHLELRILGGNPATAALQAAQASELNLALALTPSANPASRLILAGDFNSAPTHDLIGPIVPPYQQFANGLTIFGSPAFLPMTDTWTLRPGKPDGFTCCETANLMNGSSEHDERVDVIFARPAPVKVKANVMDAETTDKTASGLWPSDHASVIAELSY
jgi:endonuclease/exonuclease/phosphatase family metal-dependent hydrolase